MANTRKKLDEAALGALFEAVRPDVTPSPGAMDRLEARLREAVRLDEAALGDLFETVGPDITPPPGAMDRLEARLREAVRAKKKTCLRSAARRHAAQRWVLRGGLAAAACLAVALAGWWLLGGGVARASAGFADVLRAIRQAKTVAYTIVLGAHDARPEEELRVLSDDRGGFRATWPDGRTTIHAPNEGKWLELVPGSRIARFGGPSRGAFVGEPLEALRRATESDGELTGHDLLRGREVLVYRVRQPDGDLRVWVDPRDSLPVRIETESTGPGGPSAMILKDFRWNAPLPESAFSLEPPPGYTLVPSEAGPSEEALVEALRGCTERSGGTFPVSLDRGAIVKLLVEGRKRGRLTAQTGKDEISVGPEFDGQGKQFYRLCLSALAFVDGVKTDGSWRYVGAAVQLGDRDAPVCWWRAPGEAAFRVIYGDLTIRTVPSGSLPAARP